MKTTEEEVEEKRLRRNADRRRYYAQLSQEKKALLLQKRREKYVARKKVPLKGNKVENDANIRLTNKRIAGAATYSYPAETSHAHINKGITIRDVSTNNLIGTTCSRYEATPLDIASGAIRAKKDNTEKTLYNSIEIGESSLNAKKPAAPTYALNSDMSTAPARCTRHMTLVTDCESEQIAAETLPDHIYGRTYFATSSRRKRSERNRDEETNIIDEIQQFQSARWISAAEAMWRIYRFTMNDMQPSVQSLHLHLEENQNSDLQSKNTLQQKETSNKIRSYFSVHRNVLRLRATVLKDFKWMQKTKRRYYKQI